MEKIEIRKLDSETLKDAVILKISCWTEELMGVRENDLSFEEEYPFWLNWMNHSKKDQDHRILLGAFKDQKLVGACFASYAEVSDMKDALEINGLYIDPDYRGYHISYLLLKEVLLEFKTLGMSHVILYNHRLSHSSSYYQKLGGKVIRTDLQMDGCLIVDIYHFDLDELILKIDEKK